MFSPSTLVYALNNSIPRKLGLSRLTYWSRSQHKHFSSQICHPYLVPKIRVHHTIVRACILFWVTVDSVRYTPANAYEMLPKPMQHQLPTNFVGYTFLTNFCIQNEQKFWSRWSLMLFHMIPHMPIRKKFKISKLKFRLTCLHSWRWSKGKTPFSGARGCNPLFPPKAPPAAAIAPQSLARNLASSWMMHFQG